MVSDIRTEFEDILKTVEWMDEKTRANAIDKAKSMSTHIAYPDELLDDKKLEEFYDGVSREIQICLRPSISVGNLTCVYTIQYIIYKFIKTTLLILIFIVL